MASCASCGLPLNNPFDLSGTSSDTCQCNSGGLVTQADATSTLGCCVVSVNGKTGIVVLNINDIDLLGNQFFTNALAQAAISAVSPILYSAGVISHANSGAIAGTYGSSTMIPQLSIDAKGHVTGITQVALGAVTIGPDLTAIEALTGTGYLVRTATNTWVLRSLTGSAGRIALTYPDGVSGATVIDLVVTGVSAGTYGSGAMVPQFTVDAYGRITGATNIAIPPPTIPPHTHTLGDLSNVHDSAGTTAVPSTATTGQALVWNGTTWIPTTLPTMNNYVLGALGLSGSWLSCQCVNTLDATHISTVVNGMAYLKDSNENMIVHINSVIYIAASLLTSTSDINFVIGDVPSGWEPIDDVILPIATYFDPRIYKNNVGSIAFTGTQYIKGGFSVRIKPDRKVYLNYDKAGAVLAQLSGVDNVLVPIVGSYLTKTIDLE